MPDSEGVGVLLVDEAVSKVVTEGEQRSQSRANAHQIQAAHGNSASRSTQGHVNSLNSLNIIHEDPQPSPQPPYTTLWFRTAALGE